MRSRLNLLLTCAACQLLSGPLRAAQLSAYEIAPQPWNPEWGSHRVVVKVEADAPLVHSHLEWRRRDRNPERRGVRIQSLKDAAFVKDVTLGSLSNETGDLIFRPAS